MTVLSLMRRHSVLVEPRVYTGSTHTATDQIKATGWIGPLSTSLERSSADSAAPLFCTSSGDGNDLTYLLSFCGGARCYGCEQKRLNAHSHTYMYTPCPATGTPAPAPIPGTGAGTGTGTGTRQEAFTRGEGLMVANPT